MVDLVFHNLDLVFSDVLSEMITLIVRFGLLVWGVFMARLLGAGLYDVDTPYKRRVILLSMPASVLLALFFAFWSFRGIVNPGETRTEAMYDAQFTFWCALIPLWSGCLWGIVRHPDLNKNNNRRQGGSPRV